MPEHMGRRRRPARRPWGRIALLAAPLVVVGVLFALPDPPGPPPGHFETAVSATPTWQGPPTFDAPGTMPDGAAYTPRIYLDSQVSIGVAPTADGRSLRLVLRNAARVTELRRLATTETPDFNGFTADGDTVAWAETRGTSTSLLRTNWRTAGRPILITDGPGDVTFAGSQYDMVLHAGRIWWTAQVDGATETRSLQLDGYGLQTRRLTGDYGLSAWPWATSRGGPGTAIKLVNLSTSASLAVPVGANQTGRCGPTWCRVDTAGANALVRIDVRRTDGSRTVQAAGSEATPAIADAVLADRWVPLLTDDPSGTGLSVYDVNSGQTTLVGVGVDNVKAYGSLLWWSTGSGGDLRWHLLDLRTLT